MRLTVNGNKYDPSSIKSYYPRGGRSSNYEGGWVKMPSHSYCVWFYIDGKPFAVDGKASLAELAEWLRRTRKIGIELHWRKIERARWELLCPWCGVRPDRWEWDCDGEFPMSSCGSEQCDNLKRCEGCGRDGIANHGTMGGKFCEECYQEWRCEIYSCLCLDGGPCRYRK